MSLIRLFIDEDSMDRQFVRALRARGVDVTTVGEIGTTSFSDEDFFVLATEQQRVLYTFNVGDFCQLHSVYMAEGQTHTGMGVVISSWLRLTRGRGDPGTRRDFLHITNWF